MSLTRADFECLIDYLKKGDQPWRVKVFTKLYEDNLIMREALEKASKRGGPMGSSRICQEALSRINKVGG